MECIFLARKNCGREKNTGASSIRNGNHEQYMQVDDDDEPNYTNDGGIAEVRSFDGADYQRWIFTNAANEYYRTTSKISGYALSVLGLCALAVTVGRKKKERL